MKTRTESDRVLAQMREMAGIDPRRPSWGLASVRALAAPPGEHSEPDLDDYLDVDVDGDGTEPSADQIAPGRLEPKVTAPAHGQKRRLLRSRLENNGDLVPMTDVSAASKSLLDYINTKFKAAGWKRSLFTDSGDVGQVTWGSPDTTIAVNVDWLTGKGPRSAEQGFAYALNRIFVFKFSKPDFRGTDETLAQLSGPKLPHPNQAQDHFVTNKSGAKVLGFSKAEISKWISDLNAFKKTVDHLVTSNAFKKQKRLQRIGALGRLEANSSPEVQKVQKLFTAYMMAVAAAIRTLDDSRGSTAEVRKSKVNQAHDQLIDILDR